MNTKTKLIRKISIHIHQFLHKKKNGFNHIVSLGYNCEVAFRFLEYFNFEESNLFNWTYSRSIEDLINALKNLDYIGRESFQLPNPLWECNKTHIRFHGKEDMGIYIRGEATPYILRQDLEELMSRIQYLKEKFIRIARSTDTKLYIYKLHTTDIDSNIENKLLQLYNALVNHVQAKNFKLLIIYEKQRTPIKENAAYMLRTVKYFAPDDDVTGKKYMNNGWDKIFHEFYQNTMVKKVNKKYKFEK